MLSLATKATIAQDKNFIDRVTMAVYSVCYDVLEEDQEFPNNPIRLRLASGFVQTSPEQMMRFSNMVVNNPEVEELELATHEDIPDKLILKIILKAWNGIAGILE